MSHQPEVDDFSLEGKRILVTGASSGIGRQIAITCDQMGAQLVLSGRHDERLKETFSNLSGSGHSTVVADLTQKADVDQLVAQTGIVNGVVHAAGISKLVPFRLITQEHLEDMFGSNTFAPILLTKALLSKKQIAAGGAIVFIASVASHVGPMASSAYASSKSALLGMVRSLGLEVAKQKIRANCIAPGYVQTPLLESLQGSGGNLESLFDLTPLGMGTPEDIANTAVFMLADASRWITRDYLIVDGGLSVPMDIYA